MSIAPKLQAGPLVLHPFDQRHLTKAYVGWLNDPDVVRFSEQRHRQHSMESCRAFFSGFATGPNLLWAIETREGGQHIGNITATIDVNNKIADIGIMIGAANARGKGYGRHAWGAVLGHLCARADLRKVTGGCLAANTAMVQLMRTCGMTEDGSRPDHYLVEGHPTSILYFAKPGNWANT
jgi:[ribosomal protein S5]-alanine N-acetyltransferase